jgi:hypothetical protein
VKSPFDDPDTVELYFRDNTELDPVNSGCWLWRAPPVKSRRYRRKGGVSRALYQIAFELFKGPVPDGHVVHHVCENFHCINPGHLKALTVGEHMKVHFSGEKNVNAVLTDGVVREIFDLVKKGVLQREIGKIYGVTQSCISNLLHNRRWPHIYSEVFKGAPPKDFRFRSRYARMRTL